LRADVLIIGAGPAGAAAAYHAARAGWDTLVIDMADHATEPRDKTCGDGLTPRAVGALEAMGAGHLLDGHPQIKGLKLHGFGGSITAPWPEHEKFPARGSAIPRSDFDAALLRHAIDAGARVQGGLKAVGVSEDGRTVTCQAVGGRAGQSAGTNREARTSETRTDVLGTAEGRRSTT